MDFSRWFWYKFRHVQTTSKENYKKTASATREKEFADLSEE